MKRKEYIVREFGNGGPVIYWATFLHQENEMEHMIQVLSEEAQNLNFLLVAFLAEDWNRDFSPWEAPPAFGNEGFAGEGRETLDWLIKEGIPEVAERFGKERDCYLIGYSLAGLFALWAAYETDQFRGIACCSGSLWFEGWDQYVKEHAIVENCDIYLSLGGKEEKTRNQIMARVGDRTRQQEEILKKDKKVRNVILEWNSGGHFADSGKRLAKGIKWLLTQR